MAGKLKIIVAHHHRLLGEAIAEALSREPDFKVIGWTKRFIDAGQLAIDNDADIIVTAASLAGNTEIRFKGCDLLVLPLYDGQPSENGGAAKISRVSLNGELSDLHRLIRSTASKYVEHFCDSAEEHADLFTSLTSREREIYSLIAQGLSNQQIGRLLYITERTVKYHVSNVLRKLNVGSRTEAAVRFVKAAR